MAKCTAWSLILLLLALSACSTPTPNVGGTGVALPTIHDPTQSFDSGETTGTFIATVEFPAGSLMRLRSDFRTQADVSPHDLAIEDLDRLQVTIDGEALRRDQLRFGKPQWNQWGDVRVRLSIEELKAFARGVLRIAPPGQGYILSAIVSNRGEKQPYTVNARSTAISLIVEQLQAGGETVDPEKIDPAAVDEVTQRAVWAIVRQSQADWRSYPALVRALKAAVTSHGGGGSFRQALAQSENAGASGSGGGGPTVSPSSPSPAVSLAANHIALTSNSYGGEVFVLTADGQGLVNVSNHATANDRAPVISPDGNRIAFVSNRDGNSEIYVANLDGTGLLDVSINGAEDRNPTWSPDSSKLAFVSQRDGNAEIYSVNRDGTGLANLTQDLGADDLADYDQLDWSPDGSKIVFSSDRGGAADIYVMNADGSNLVNLSNSAFGDFYAAWSPTGNQLAFLSVRDGHSEIYSVAPDGSGLVRLTNSADSVSRFAWSPDGMKLVFVRANDVFLIQQDGTGVLNLTNSGNTQQKDQPYFSPNGALISFLGDSGAGADVYTMQLDGSNLTPVTSGAQIFPTYFWLPDGAGFIYASATEAYAVGKSGGAAVHLTADPDLVGNGMGLREPAFLWAP